MKISKNLIINIGRFLLFLCFVVGFIAKPNLNVQAAGSTYYVSPSGNDSNSGTLSSPWKTIGKAAYSAKAGDTVYIRGGTYTESVSIANSGSSSSPITFTAYPSETPIIDGKRSIPSSGSYLILVHGNYVNISGIEVINSNYGGIYVDGSFDVVDNVYVHHNRAVGIYVSKGQYSTVKNSRIWRNSLSNEYGTAGAWGSGLSAARSGVSYVTFSNNHVWENWGEGISTYESSHITIVGNIANDNYSTNIYISDTSYVLCDGNFVYMDPSSYVYGGTGSNVGIMMGDETSSFPSANITVTNNIAYGNHRNFHWWKGPTAGLTNVLIANNTFVNSTGSASSGEGNVIISPGTHVNVRFINNIVSQDDSLPVIATVSQAGVTYSHNNWSSTPYAAASGTGDIIGKPGFTKNGSFYGPEYFRLTSTSQDIEKGMALSEVTKDFFGTNRVSLPDLGAIEFGTGNVAPTPTNTSTPTPVLTSLMTNKAQAGSSSINLLVNGSNFVNGAKVLWNGEELTTNYVSSSQLSAVVPQTKLEVVGEAFISVANPNLVAGISDSQVFDVYTFADVLPGSWYWKWVEGSYAQGITTGCTNGPLQYCPDRAVTRAEMAVLLLRAKDGLTPPTPASTGIFDDVPFGGKEWMQPWIEQFYSEGITTGCATSPFQYCPERQVTRAEMAVFILRAKYGKDYMPPASTGVFSDVPVSGKEWMQPWVEEFYREGITTGCSQSPLSYCPEQSVTRAEMATFIDRAFGYSQLP